MSLRVDINMNPISSTIPAGMGVGKVYGGLVLGGLIRARLEVFST